jgi:hypothetical protein
MPTEWAVFECDGRTFEFATIPTRGRTRPAGWPAHKAAPGPSVRSVAVIVRKIGDETGPAMLFPDGTNTTTEHAVETARFFWATLTE